MSEPDSLLDQIKKNLGENNHQEALTGAEQLVTLQPENAEAWFLKGKALFSLEEFGNSATALEHAVGFGLGASESEARTILTECYRQRTLKSVKRDWYQTETHVTIAILLKKVKATDVDVDYEEDRLRFAVTVPGTDVVYRLDARLAGNILKEQCSFKVLPSKVEIRLKKADGSRWSALEADEVDAATAGLKSFEVNPTQSEMKPAYPTSSKKSKDWDKLEHQVKLEEKDEKLEGDAALNKLFQDIYSNATEETRRAMNKSFQESNGTVLSTNWNEIGAKHTDMQCPDGMEYKQYD